MALDPNGNHGVSRRPMPPKDAPTHRLCDDTGFVQHTGRWEFCLCSFGRREREKNPKAAEEMNYALDRLNAKVAK
jgi:hypothetical protein